MKKILLVALMAITFGMVSNAEEITFDWTSYGFTNNESIDGKEFTKAPVAISFDKNRGTSTQVPKYQSSNECLMIYKTNIVTVAVEAGYKLDKIIFNTRLTTVAAKMDAVPDLGTITTLTDTEAVWVAPENQNVSVVKFEKPDQAGYARVYETVVYYTKLEEENPIENVTFSCTGASSFKSSYVTEDEDPEGPFYLLTIESRKDTVDVTVNLPDGYEEMYYFNWADLFGGGMKKAVPVEDIEAIGMYKKGNVITVNVNNEEAVYTVMFAKDGMADDENPINLKVIADKKVGVATVDSDNDAKAEFFNLNGVKVENPTKGLYLKKVGNKTVKVIK